MAKLKYKDENGFWQELQVGTNVVANPMLTGTEQELTSLQVGNAKYKSGGGKLYQHTITLGNSKTDGSTALPGALTCRVINTKNTPYTQSTITIETVANVAFSGFNDAASGQAPILYEGVFVNYQNTFGIICVQILGYGTSDYNVKPYFSSGLPINYDPVSDTVTEL